MNLGLGVATIIFAGRIDGTSCMRSRTGGLSDSASAEKKCESLTPLQSIEPNSLHFPALHRGLPPDAHRKATNIGHQDEQQGDKKSYTSVKNCVHDAKTKKRYSISFPITQSKSKTSATTRANSAL